MQSLNANCLLCSKRGGLGAGANLDRNSCVQSSGGGFLPLRVDNSTQTDRLHHFDNTELPLWTNNNGISLIPHSPLNSGYSKSWCTYGPYGRYLRTMPLLRKHHSDTEACGPLRASELGSQMINRRKRGDRHIGLADGARRSQLGPDLLEGSKKERYEKYKGNIPLEDEEKYVRSKVENRPMILVLIGYYTALKIFLLYLISLSSIITCALSVGLTIHWYNTIMERSADGSFVSIGMDWVILGFAVVTPLSLSVNISFRRRERALIEISKFRSFAFQLLLSHAVWDWDKGGKASVPGINWVAHTDEVLTELIAVGE